MSYPMARIALAETFSFNSSSLEESAGVEKLPGGRYRFRAKAQHCGVKNRNNRVYPVAVWEQHLTPTAQFYKRIQSRRVIGHLEHPTDGKSAMGLAAVLVVEVAAPNKKGEVWAIFETLSTPAGRIVEAFVRDGVGFGISSRGNGSVINKGGIDEVQGDYEPVTFDMVIDESTPGAEVHARRLKESLVSLMESVGGSQVHAIRRDQELAEEAIARDLLAENAPPTGFSAFLLAFQDGSAHYRCYDDGQGKWDVWLHPHNLPPEGIVNGMSTQEAAGQAAQQHHKLVQVSGQRAAGKEASNAMRRDWASVREAYSVTSAMPYSGIALKLVFASGSEAKSALGTVQRAGFHADLEDATVCVYTSIEDEDAATAHLGRLLGSKGINMQAESVGFISHGRAVWEDEMPHLNEMPYGMGAKRRHGMREMPYGAGTGMKYDEMPYEADDADDDDDGGMMYGEAGMDYDADDDADDDDEADDEAMYEMPYAPAGDTPGPFTGDDPEDIDLDIDVDEDYEENDMDGMYEDDASDGYVKIWFDGDDDPVEYHYFDGDGVLEAVTDSDGTLLMEGPSKGQRAMFAKAFASTPRSKKTGKPKDPSQTAAAVRARPGGAEYYRKFRRKWTKTKSGKGTSPQMASKFGVRVKKGKGSKGRAAHAGKRRVKRTGMKHQPAEKVRKDRRVKRALAASVEQVYDAETGLIETTFDGEVVMAHEPESGVVMFEHPDYDVEGLLMEGPSKGQRAMFAKAFASTPRSKKTGKPKDPSKTAAAVRARPGGAEYYRKFRRKWTKTKSGKGVSPQMASKFGVRVKKGGGSKGRAAVAGKRRVKRTGMKHQPAEKVRKDRRVKRALAASYEGGNDSLIFEEESGLFVCEDTNLVFDSDHDLVGAIDSEGYIIEADDLDEDWLDEAIAIFEGGTSPEKAGIRMKGAAYMGTHKTNAPGGHGGGKAKGVKTRSGSPASMRGNGKMSYGEQEYDESYEDEYEDEDDQDESFDPYTARLETQIARQQEVIDAFQDLQQVEALENHKAEILGSYPELSVVESRLDRCQTVAEMREEAEALLSLVETTRGTRTYSDGTGGNAHGSSSVNSGNVNGAPQAGLLAESEGAGIGVDLGSAPSDTASRVAASRRRRLAESTQDSN